MNHLSSLLPQSFLHGFCLWNTASKSASLSGVPATWSRQIFSYVKDPIATRLVSGTQTSCFSGASRHPPQTELLRAHKSSSLGAQCVCMCVHVFKCMGAVRVCGIRGQAQVLVLAGHLVEGGTLVLRRHMGLWELSCLHLLSPHRSTWVTDTCDHGQCSHRFWGFTPRSSHLMWPVPPWPSLSAALDTAL